MNAFFIFSFGFIVSSLITVIALCAMETLYQPLLSTQHYAQSMDQERILPQIQRQNKNIFIDVGANRGDTFFKLLNESKFFPPYIHRRDIDVYLFEASPIWNDLLYKLYTQYRQIIRVYNGTALWINSTEKLVFFVDNNNHEASSSFHKMYGATQITVDCIDICEWMLYDRHFHINDTVIIKLDVEGAEYKIIEHIWNNTDCLSLVDEMFVEWHPWGQQKWTDGNKHHYLERGQKWTQLFQSKGVKMHKWD